MEFRALKTGFPMYSVGTLVDEGPVDDSAVHSSSFDTIR